MASKQYRDVVIIGAGHAGAELAWSLRQRGFSGSILLASDEPALPYERPPLSKACLLDVNNGEPPLLRKAESWGEQKVDLVLSVKAIALDTRRKSITFSDGRVVEYGWCALATGGRLRQLTCPGAQLGGILSLRNQADMQKLRTALGKAKNMVIVGGGYVGLEVAASSRELGKNVTVVETSDRVLSRVTSPSISAFVTRYHEERGVRFFCQSGVRQIVGKGCVDSVILQDGTQITADLVVVGIGIDPETSVAQEAGIACHDGVLVDSSFRTSAGNVVAIGDCCRHPNELAGGLWRLESVQHAQASAALAAGTITGDPTPYQEVPTFWSEQYNLRLQSAGFFRNADRTIIRGTDGEMPFSAIYLRDNRVVAIDAVNSSRDFMAARKLISLSVQVDPTDLADPGKSLRELT